MRTVDPLKVRLIVLCLTRRRAHMADMILETLLTIVVLCFKATANGPSVFLESWQHVISKVVFQTSLLM